MLAVAERLVFIDRFAISYDSVSSALHLPLLLVDPILIDHRSLFLLVEVHFVFVEPSTCQSDAIPYILSTFFLASALKQTSVIVPGPGREEGD